MARDIAVAQLVRDGFATLTDKGIRLLIEIRPYSAERPVAPGGLPADATSMRSPECIGTYLYCAGWISVFS